MCCVFRKDLNVLLEFFYYCLLHHKSVSMTILRYIVMNLKNLFTQYLSASNLISSFTVRAVC